MIHIFRTNLFINSLLLLVYTLVVRSHALLYPEPVATDAASNAIQSWLLGLPLGARGMVILSCLMVYLQGIMINRLVIKNRMGQDISLLPGMIFILLTSLLPQWLQWHLPLLANFLLILGLGRLYSSYRNQKAAVNTFDVGLCFGIASILSPPYVVFLLLGYIGLIILRSMKWTDRAQYVSGIVVPYFLWFAYEYWVWGSSDVLAYLWLLVDMEIPRFEATSEWYLVAVTTLLAVVFVLTYSRYTGKKPIQVQKKIDILYWLMLLSGFFVFHSYISSALLYALFIPIAFFIAQRILRMGNLFLVEALHIAVLIGTLLFHFGIVKL